MAKITGKEFSVFAGNETPSKEELERLGLTQESYDKVGEFALDTINEAQGRGLTPSDAYNALLTALIHMINNNAPSGLKATLIGTTIEAICVGTGGESDTAVRTD